MDLQRLVLASSIQSTVAISIKQMPGRNPPLTLLCLSYLVPHSIAGSYQKASNRAREFELKGNFEVTCKEEGECDRLKFELIVVVKLFSSFQLSPATQEQEGLQRVGRLQRSGRPRVVKLQREFDKHLLSAF